MLGDVVAHLAQHFLEGPGIIGNPSIDLKGKELLELDFMELVVSLYHFHNHIDWVRSHPGSRQHVIHHHTQNLLVQGHVFLGGRCIFISILILDQSNQLFFSASVLTDLIYLVP